MVQQVVGLEASFDHVWFWLVWLVGLIVAGRIGCVGTHTKRENRNPSCYSGESTT